MNTAQHVARMGKIGIDFIIRHLTESQHSHEASWAYLRYNQLKNLGFDVEVIHDDIAPQAEYDAWARYDTIMIYHSMAAFPDDDKCFGSVAVKLTDKKKTKASRGAPPPVNVYDIGVDQSAWYFARLAWPQHEKLKYVSLDFPMIPYGSRCRYKSPRPGTSDTWKAVDWEAVQRRLDREPDWCIDPYYAYSDEVHRLVVGDSHSHSVYQPGSMVLRRDGRTMYAINRIGVLNEAKNQGIDPSRIGPLTCYYGNIDIRHHLCRQENPVDAARKLLADYEEMLKRTERPIELVMPLPIEDESRIVPRMGWYKDTPFYGSRQDRMVLVDVFIDAFHHMVARNPGWSLYSWPKEWYEMDGIEFFQYMERPRSVHLAWKNYRWDLKANELNKALLPSKTSSLLEF